MVPVDVVPVDELWAAEAAWRIFALMAVLFGIARALWPVMSGSPEQKTEISACEDILEDIATGSRKSANMTPEKIEATLRSMGAPSFPHEEGAFVPPDGRLVCNCHDEPYPIENEFCTGYFMSMHRPTHDKALDRSGTYPHGKYFLNKTRLWEARVQFNFKVPPKVEDIFFGVEITQYTHMAGAARRTMELVVNMLKGVVGQQVYHTIGDDPETTHGPIERPAFMMPLWAFDQFIVTPEGETPPKLNDPAIPSMGKKRSGRVKEYRKEIDSLDFKVGPTYTLCFWGISRFLDKINWQLRLPLSPMPLSLSMFCGGPPVHVVIYTLKPSNEGEEEKRHLQDRKNYYLNSAFWSSKDRPPFSKLDGLLKLTERMPPSPTAANRRPSTGSNGISPRRLSGQFEKFRLQAANISKEGMGSWITCCAPFIARPPPKTPYTPHDAR